MTRIFSFSQCSVAKSLSFRRKLFRFGLLSLLGGLPLAQAPAQNKAPITQSAPIASPTVGSDAQSASPLLVALRQELDRSMKRLRLKGYEAPYFISYTLRDIEEAEVIGKNGAVYGKSRDRRRVLHVEVRVGSYELDNTSAGESEGDADLALSLSEVSKDAPLDDDLDALRGSLWLLTDQKYKAALASYARKKARGVRDVEPEDKLPSFSKEKPNKFVGDPPRYDVSLDQMAESVRVAGARLKQAPVLDGEVKLNADRVSRYFVSSEGAETIEHRTIFAAHVSAEARAKDGMLLSNARDFYGRSAEQLPTAQALASAVDGLVRDLALLQAAPAADPYNGPAILMEEAAGVFFHETIGHRLEGERQVSEQEGRTFKGQIGHKVLPTFLSVLDDPTLQTAVGGIPLNGFYRFDDEGVPARPVTLIEKGVLRDYLKSRTPVLGSLRSNGHGRAEGTSDPIGRMANLVVRAEQTVPLGDLKAQLLAEVHRQGKPYGLIIRDILGGSTNTMSFGSQTFRGQPTMVYRVDAKTGEETLVRGVEMVGTPLSSMAKIVAASDTVGVFNGYCGAESGMAPVSTVAPAVLFTEIELQRAQHVSERPPILPPPWRDDATPSRK
ncbi:MAG: TldD/PmbA family protein [Myxococcales bacterium]|nr:TldD/PmbA family protein [Myxococcales bacterium]